MGCGVLRRLLVRLAVAAAVACGGAITPLAAQYDQPGAPRAAAAFTILQINDVYSTVAVDGAGGLARVATLKRQVAEAGGQPLLMLAGDFLSSSVASTIFKGEQMVAALNAAGLDMATLGNHEFDFGVDVLLQRMHEARWQWVISNVLDRRTGRPIGEAAPYVVRTFGELKVGVIGLCLTGDPITRDTLERIEILDPFTTAARYLDVLARENVDVVVALTHLDYADDRALARRFPAIDVIVGGHEHIPITATVGQTLISKSGTDARHVARIDVGLPEPGLVERHFELVPVTAAVPEDPHTAEVVEAFEGRLDAGLEVTVGRTAVPLDGIGTRLRTSETNLGNIVADAVRASVGADIGLVNGGGIRGDRVHPVGPLLRRAVVEIHPFGNLVCKVRVPGRVILEALEHGVARLPAPAGEFLQISGMTMRVEAGAPPGARIRDVRIGGAAIQLERAYTVALPNYLLLGGDGYHMFAGADVVVGPQSGQPMALALEDYLAGREIAPPVEQRIVITR
jgi:5'-nucleotidase